MAKPDGIMIVKIDDQTAAIVPADSTAVYMKRRKGSCVWKEIPDPDDDFMSTICGFYCSECNEPLGSYVVNFCPQCGADLREAD